MVDKLLVCAGAAKHVVLDLDWVWGWPQLAMTSAVLVIGVTRRRVWGALAAARSCF